MNTVTKLPAGVNLFADAWDARTVGEYAANAIRRHGNMIALGADLQARADKPIVNGERRVNTRRWTITDTDGEVLAEENSLYRAIHKIAR
jgi:hypothetical protein